VYRSKEQASSGTFSFTMAPRFLAAVCHVSPIILSAQKITQKCISLIKQAAKNSADLVVFPESHIPAFPVWGAIQRPTQKHGFFQLMAKESLFIDGVTARRCTLYVTPRFPRNKLERWSVWNIKESTIQHRNIVQLQYHHRF